jgi:hypothetical protein
MLWLRILGIVQELLLNAMERKEISASTMLIKENEEGDEMYVIETGELSVAIGNRVRAKGRRDNGGEHVR